MRKLSTIIFSIIAAIALLVLQNCGDKDKETEQERTLRILTSKTWTVSTVNVPINTATEASDWSDFTVSFTQSDMTTANHPTGAQAVWPSISYTVNSDGTIIARGDGIDMLLNPISDTNFTAIFTVPPGTELGGSRISALEGEYTFNMK